MSLIARCPVCQTWYKVVPDQLRISGGWVRCGQCAEVFDVSLQLVEAESELPPDPAQTDAPEFSPRPDGAGAALHDASIGMTEPATVEHLLSAGAEMLVTPPAPERLPLEAQPEVPWNSAALLVKRSVETEADAGSGTRCEPEREVAEPVATASVLVAEPVSFLRAPAVRQHPHRNGKSLLWGVLGVLLTLGMLLQGLYRERDQLAALKPEFKLALQTFCEVLGCRISPMQRIEALVLDSATFHQVDPETFQLHFFVKNRAQLELALPTIELTLTDLTDQPVMRRVFTPDEMGATTQTIPAAGEWSATADLRVKTESTQQRALGYRLLIFYP